MEAYWYTDNFDNPLSFNANSNISPRIPSNTLNTFLNTQWIACFSTVNNVNLPSSHLIIDTNKFLLSNNTYDQNFISDESSLNEIINFRRIHMISEIYVKKNTGKSWESLNKYGSIKSICDVKNILSSNNFVLYAYYGATGNNYTLLENINVKYLDLYYPVSPIIIQVALYVYIDGIVFDNNSQQEINTKYLNSQYPSGAITFRMCKGALYLNNLTIRNYKGFDQAICYGLWY